MQIVSELSSIKPKRDTLLAVGVFDGVHLGHKHLLGKLTQQAARDGLLSGVVTFSSNPKAVLSHRAKLARLTTVEERVSLLKSLGVDLVVPITFTTEVAAISARDFVTYLKQYLRMKGLVIGPNFALGHGREGNAEVLKLLGEELDFTVDVVKPLMIESSLVSSTVVRQALSHGDMKLANELLGRYFKLSGAVVDGVERGRVLGFPTANINVDSEQALPHDGVYATLAYIGDEVYQSVTNIGKRPTFGGGERSVEVYLLDFDRDIYGENLTIELVEHLRPEMKFASPEELAEQIGKDVEHARALLKRPLAGAKNV
ncbi:MAG TPA: bifunctional riboflavin kinase/FAD synthetase [Dehalococcoidia bacterium]|nr:bifunctional riboflavin kinase/FAD synthetase [Dehalococcoidia bacterium]